MYFCKNTTQKRDCRIKFGNDIGCFAMQELKNALGSVFEIAGGNAGRFFEDKRKIMRIRKAALIRDVGASHIGGAQKALGFFNAHVREIFDECGAALLRKNRGEMIRA